MNKRIKVLCIALGVIFLALVVRLGYIQLIGHEDLSAVAKSQQLIAIQGVNSRGLIYDRNNRPLVGNNQEYITIIKENKFTQEAETILNTMGAREIPNKGSGYKVFTAKEYDKALGQQLVDKFSAYIIEAGRRYKDGQTGVHLLGYVNEQDGTGITGIEKMCDGELRLLQKKIYTTADVMGNIIGGQSLVISTAMDKDSYVKKGVTITLDGDMQQGLEEILSEENTPCGGVILDSESGEILASASTPTFNPNKISTYMDSNENQLVNKVTQGEYPPGSIFKIIVAAAALEQGMSTEDTFHCKGYENINGKKIKCQTGGEKGHGKITFHQAFAQSCNSSFIQIGEKVGAQGIIDMAQKFGLGEKTLVNYPDEKVGNLMETDQAAGAAIANLSIGQGEILATPIQMAKMTNIIALEGIDAGVHVIEDKEDQGESRVISKETAVKIKKMMEEVMKTGSGKELSAEVEMAGKTGSAQGILGNEEVVHGWFTGFVPAKNPEYTITVLVENGKSGSQSAGPIFEKIVKYLEDSKSFSQAFGS
ncbi:MAG: penicillin-binding transpeptidase domain-containing protein [Anaerovoracaceae bacterium]